MRILMLGLSCATASLEVRSRAAIPTTALSPALAALVAHPAILEAAILSTCNRTEIYAVASETAAGFEALEAFWVRAHANDDAIRPHLVKLDQEEAIRRLFRVAAGLESQILGEGQILAQVKEAHAAAQATGSSGAILDALFRLAITAGKRSRSETAIAQGAVSAAAAALELAKQLMGPLLDRRFLVLGTGAVGELALKQLRSLGAGSVFVSNRSLESAQTLAEGLGAEAVAFHTLGSVLPTVDIVLCCTGAPHHVLTASELEPIMRTRQARPLLMIDVSVPRNLDPDIRRLEGVTLCDLEHLEAIAQGHRRERERLVPEVEAILAEEREAFHSWLHSYQLMPTINGLKTAMHETCERDLSRFFKQHAGALSEQQQLLVGTAIEGILDNLLHRPIGRLKRLSPLQQQQLVPLLKGLFDLRVENLEEHHRRRLSERRDAIKCS